MKPTFKLGEQPHHIIPQGDGVVIDGVFHAPPFRDVPMVEDGADLLVKWGTEIVRIHNVSPFEAAGGGAGGQDEMRAPMPGTVISLSCAAGDTVTQGKELLVIESMKLQTSIRAPREGVIAELPLAAAQTFNKGDVLVRFEPVEEGTE
ncbi:MAG: acetyl-CoA carboxylase biotin carboxyl carrier protein subunit [Alphaproteobacteria bacterium]